MDKKVAVPQQQVINQQWETISNFNHKYISWVVGHHHSNLRKVEEKYDLEIVVDESSSIIKIKGCEENRCRFKVYLYEIMIRNGKTAIPWSNKNKIILAVGLSRGEGVTLKQSNEQPLLRTLHANGEISRQKSYANINGLKEAMLTAFQTVREKILQNPDIICDVMLHTGKIYSKEEEGEFTFNQIFGISPEKHLVYHKLTPKDLKFEKFENTQQLNKTYRYDITFCTPEPFREYRYKIYAERDEFSGKTSFITAEQAGEPIQQFSTVRVGPGYFSLDSIRIASFDIVDLTNNGSLRLNIFHSQHESYDEDLNHHIENLKDSFLGKIRLLDKSNGCDIDIPSMPQGYLLKYLRSAVRKSYGFTSDKVMCTSAERIHIDRSNPNYSKQEFDVFFMDEEFERKLKSNEWDAQEIVEKFEDTLKFSDIVMPYLY